MDDGVKFIFRTLLKVPIIVMVSFALFNLFAFTLTYFKMLGFSYVVMQTAVENNYIPPQELNTLNSYLKTLDDGTPIIDGAQLILLGDPSKNESGVEATKKRQYGESVTVGVAVHYQFIWPLTPRDQLQNPETDNFIGNSDNVNFSGYADNDTLENRRAELAGNPKNNIKIVYTVPGLKYYPDLT